MSSPLDQIIESLEATAPRQRSLSEAEQQELIRSLNLTSCDFVGDSGCSDPDCWQCHSPLSPSHLRTLAENLATAGMLCRAHQLRDEQPGWQPGCNLTSKAGPT